MSNSATVLTGQTALGGGGQAGATAFNNALFMQVGTCVANGDSVVLPAANIGQMVYLRNDGATNCAVFPPPGGRINAVAADNSVTVNAATQSRFICTKNNGQQWFQL